MRFCLLLMFGVAMPLAGQPAPVSQTPHALGGAPVRIDSAAREALARDSAMGLSWTLPGHQGWTRYTHPAECVAAIEMLQMTTMHRTNWRSPVVLDDTLSTVARNAGTACGKKFTVANVSSREWFAFLDLSLRLGNLPLAHDIVANQLRLATTVDAKASVLADALTYFSGRTPGEVATADSLLRTMAALGPRARWWTIASTYASPKPPTLDTARVTRFHRDLETQWRALTHDDRVLAGFVVPQFTGDWYVVREYARTDPSDICRMMHTEFQGVGTDTLGPGITIEGFTNMLENDCKTEVASIGTTATPLTGARWFRPGDTVGTTGPYVPAPGRVTLVIVEPAGAGRPSWQQVMFSRLAKQFGARGLDIVLVQRRRGYLWGSGALSAEQETQLIRWYDHDYLKLPVTVAVYDSAATDVPRPMLIGRDGRHILGNVVLNSDWSANEYVVAAFIEQALGMPASQLVR